jgi:GAF domain-containing protein/HAMP domain-containing protein
MYQSSLIHPDRQKQYLILEKKNEVLDYQAEMLMNAVKSRKEIKYLLDISLFVPIFGGLTIAGLLIIFIFIPDYQLLQVCVIAALGSLIFLLSRVLILKSHPSLATLIMVVVGALFFPAFDLFWSGFLIPLIIGAWVVPSAISWYGFDFNKYTNENGRRLLIYHRFFVLFISTIVTVLILLIEKNRILTRLSVSNAENLKWLIPLFTLLGGLLALVLIIRTPILNSLFVRMVLAFLIIVLVPVITISSSMVINTYESDPQVKIRSIQGILVQETRQIDNWILSLNELVTNALQNNPSRADLISFLQTSSSLTSQAAPYFTKVQKSIIQLQEQNELLKDVLIFGNNGQVLASTNPVFLNQNFAFRELFWKGKSGYYISPPMSYPNIDGYSVFVSRPILDNTGSVIGVLAIRSDTWIITDLIKSSLITQGNQSAYIVNSNNEVLPGFTFGNPSSFILNEIASLAWSKNNYGSIQHTRNQDKPLIAIYHWIPEISIAIIVETTPTAPSTNFIQIIGTNLVVAFLASLIALIGAVIIARSISSPIKELSYATHQIAGGNLTIRTSSDYSDELSSLSLNFNIMAERITGLITNLEDIVAERTRNFEKREKELKVAAEVARDVSTSRQLHEILKRSSQLIHDRFGFYHVGIFLLDDKKEYAVLQAASGEAGKLLLANQHKLKVGETGMVGFVTKTGEPRLSLGTGDDIVHFNNPLLPYTRSEITLPLSIGDRIIGALDVQSDKVNAFDNDDVAILMIMSDQLAVAIENGRLLQEIKKTVSESESAFRQYTANTWQTFIHSLEIQGYSFSGMQPEPTKEISPEGLIAIQTGKPVLTKIIKKGFTNTLVVVPIKLRDQPIGVMNVLFQKEQISPELISLIEEASNRLALALENSRLLVDAQQTAFREHNVNLISTQAQCIPDLDALLQNTVRELGNIFGLQKTFIQIGLKSQSDQIASKLE